MRRSRIVRWGGLFSSFLLGGCLEVGFGNGSSGGGGSSTGGGSSSDGGDRPDVTAGTCDAWKVAYCEAVNECGTVRERADCKNRVGYVQCLDGSEFARCEKELLAVTKGSACRKWPDGCEPENLADRLEPYAACQRLHEAECRLLLSCGSEFTLDGCFARIERDEPCSKFFAVLPNAQECIEYISAMSCDEALPAECVTSEILAR